MWVTPGGTCALGWLSNCTGVILGLWSVGLCCWRTQHCCGCYTVRLWFVTGDSFSTHHLYRSVNWPSVGVTTWPAVCTINVSLYILHDSCSLGNTPVHNISVLISMPKLMKQIFAPLRWNAGRFKINWHFNRDYTRGCRSFTRCLRHTVVFQLQVFIADFDAFFICCCFLIMYIYTFL